MSLSTCTFTSLGPVPKGRLAKANPDSLRRHDSISFAPTFHLSLMSVEKHPKKPQPTGILPSCYREEVSQNNCRSPLAPHLYKIIGMLTSYQREQVLSSNKYAGQIKMGN